MTFFFFSLLSLATVMEQQDEVIRFLAEKFPDVVEHFASVRYENDVESHLNKCLAINKFGLDVDFGNEHIKALFRRIMYAQQLDFKNVVKFKDPATLNSGEKMYIALKLTDILSSLRIGKCIRFTVLPKCFRKRTVLLLVVYCLSYFQKRRLEFFKVY